MKACMVAYTYYESDNRVRRYAETLAERGDDVSVIALRHKGQSDYEVVSQVKVHRIQQRVIDETGKLSYLKKLVKFFFRSSWMLTREHLRRPYDLIHVHSVPDFQVFSAFFPKLKGARVILDIHDPVPDFFLAKFGFKEEGFNFKVLKIIEKISCQYADHVITVTDYWRDVIQHRSNIPPQKIATIVNYPDIKLFDIKQVKVQKTSDGCFKILYPGTLNKHCALPIIIEAIALLRSQIPEIRFDIYGKGAEEKYIRSLVKQLELEENVILHDFVPLDDVPALMAGADVGIALLGGDNSYLRQALNVKLFEFFAMGLPAIASKVESIEKYVGDQVAMLSNPNDPVDVAKCILTLYQSKEKRDRLKKAGLKFTNKNNWNSQSATYMGIVRNLLPHTAV